MRVGHEAGTAADIAPTAEDIRRSVTDIACGVLERDDVDPAVDLFDQGATSLAYIRIVAEIDERYGFNLEVAEIEEASVDALTALIQTQMPARTGRSVDPTPITASASH
jgi:acyl carrier protein